MLKNPFLNSLFAIIYIFLVVVFMNAATQNARNRPDTFFAPVILLSVLTLSVAIMAFLFFYQPLLLLLEGHKKDALTFFIKIVSTFAIFTIIALGLLFFGII